MNNKAFAALIFSVLTANQVLAFDEVEGRCFTLNKLVKRHDEILSEGPKEGLDTIFGNFNSLMTVAAGDADPRTGAQKKFLFPDAQKRLLELQNTKLEVDEYKEGAAKEKATNKVFFDMNTFVKSVFIEIDVKYPECMILNGGKQSKPTGAQPTAKPASGTPVR